MKKRAGILVATILVLILGGCGQIKYPELPDDAIAFEMGEYIDKEDDDAAYATIEYEGRTYMPYGTIGKILHERDIDACVGYLVQDGEKDTDQRVYTLVDDTEHNYLMDYYVESDLMNQPMFWRAIDTKGKEVATPEFINSLEYTYWK
ncbi:MAG: hypothetical protein ACI4ES_17470 [Roseburia sp.]